MIKCIVIEILRGTCVSVEILKGYILICCNAEGVHSHLSDLLKGYMVRERLGTPVLDEITYLL